MSKQKALHAMRAGPSITSRSPRAACDGAPRSVDQKVGQLSACYRSSGHFYEIYDARTGVLDGGWQAGRHWDSEPDQTWSATAYLAMIYRGLFTGVYSADITLRGAWRPR